MSDQGLSLPRGLAARPSGWLQRAQLERRGVAVSVGLLTAASTWYFWTNEGGAANIAFTLGVTWALAAFGALLSRSLLFSAVSVSIMLATVVACASVKRATMNMVVHAYDLVFYLGSWSTVSFLWADHKSYVVGFVAAVLSAIVGGYIALQLDGARTSRRPVLIALMASIGLAACGAATKGERRHMQFNFENLYVSSFYASWAETLETLWRGQLIEALAPPSRALPRFALPATCKPEVKPPHIILIHQESLVPPALFPQLRYDRSVDELFKSQDGSTRKLRVETYGGASWLTEFSILAGVSTHSFGGMRQFVQTFMQGRLEDTLPQALARCGYRNTVFYPMLKNFVSNDKFYASIGLNEIFDLEAQGAKVVNERDKFYFTNALNEIGRHVAGSDKPMFTYIQTMSAHWPYDVAFEPGEKVEGGAPGTNPEMHEYLRRLSLAKLDYDFLIAELKRRFPDERFLIAHYGDHQPTATRTMLGFKEETEAEDVPLELDSPAYLTYYAMDGLNHTVPALPAVDTLDVPYLGSLILHAAGLPLTDSHAERRRIMMVCDGRYYGCARKSEILAFHRRLIDSGLLARK